MCGGSCRKAPPIEICKICLGANNSKCHLACRFAGMYAPDADEYKDGIIKMLLGAFPEGTDQRLDLAVPKRFFDLIPENRRGAFHCAT